MPGASVPTEWLYVVEADVDPAIEAPWNRWYDDVHVPEMLGCPGWEWCERFVPDSASHQSYLTLYGLNGPGALETPEFAARRGWGDFGSRLRYSAKLFRRPPRSQPETSV